MFDATKDQLTERIEDQGMVANRAQSENFSKLDDY